ncbi:MAG: sel1 repeat family protein, partial [Clostridia bacterium]|nr:sel1 repeat family protein [Clostridia bacterium]
MYDYRSNSVFSAKDYLDNYRRGNYSPLFERKKGEMFLKTLPRLVREDSNIDMYAYAVMLYNFGDIQGKYKSLSIIEKLVDQHFVPAYNAYGIILYDGICINKNAASAAKWFDKAAFNGFEIGKYNYAICLLKGDGVPRDVDRAMRLIKESSDAGYNKAQHAMGIAYYKGENGFTKDVYTAFDYFKLAADNGNLKAQYLIGNMYLDGEACTKSM